MAEKDPSADFCFVHAADLHLDTPFKGVSQTAPHVGSALREASLDAFDALVDLCLERKAAFLVVAGDIYDGAERGLRAQLRFRSGLQRLSDAGIATFVVHGNHDPVEQGWSVVAGWPELVHVFGHERVEAVPVVRDSDVIATVQGISYGHREVTENLALGFSSKAGLGLQVGVLHCNVAGASDGYASYSPCSLADLQRIGIDYWALGHIHSQMVLSGTPHGGDSWVVYPGNLQARSPKPSELGPKGAMVVEVHAGRVAAVEAVACDRIRFGLVEVDIAECEGAADVRSALVDAAADQLEQAAGRSLVLRGKVVGRGAPHNELCRAGAIDDLLSSLRDDCEPLEPFLWWDQIEDSTLPALDLEELRQGDDFAADLLSLADELSSRELGPAELSELIGKMPKELARMATEIVANDKAPAELIGAFVIGALDLLEVGT
ncbi:MAG: metallophosphoesterase family protein [Acidimicrobiales bacterium]